MTSKQDALHIVIDAASIHAQRMQDSLTDREVTGTFADARRSYVGKLKVALSEVKGTRYDEAGKVSERVRDLDLAESVALMHAVEDHIRSLVGRSPLS